MALPGVGPSRADAFLQYGITCVGHLPWVLPLGWDDLRAPLSVAQAVARAGERERVAVRGKVKSASRVIVACCHDRPVAIWSRNLKNAYSSTWAL